MFDTMEVGMEMLNVRKYLMTNVVRTARSNAQHPHNIIDHKIIGETSWHKHIVATHTPKHDGKHELSDPALSADTCAHDVPQDQRSQDVCMTNVRFDDVVQTIEV